MRCIVGDMGVWLPGRRILLSSHALGGVNRERREVAVRLTRRQIKDNSSLDAGKPVSRQVEEKRNRHVRSSREATGCRLQAADGELGRIEDLVIEDALWTIRYLLVDTRNRWRGRRVLVSPC